MATLSEAATQFLSCKRIAVFGVSRKSDTAATGIYRKLRERGYDVFAIHPQAEVLEGDRCFASLIEVPDEVEAALIGTPPHASAEAVRQCIEKGVRQVWIHKSFGGGSYSEEAVELCRQAGISVIPGACPMMFCEPVDPAHRCFRWLQRVTGKSPQPIGPTA